MGYKRQVGNCPLHTLPPSHWRPLYASSHLVAVGFLKENDHFCQNQTMRAANDVCLRTTAPLPVAYELNEHTGSQDRKSKQKERRKYCSQTNSLEGERNSTGKEKKLVSEISHESLRNSKTTLYILSCLACVPMFLAAVNTFSEKVLSLGLHQWKNIPHSGEKRTSMLGSAKGSLRIAKSVTSSICLCICLWPDGLWSPLTSSLKLCSLQFLSGYIGFHHPLG